MGWRARFLMQILQIARDYKLGFVEATLARKCSNEFGISLFYS